MYPFTSPIDLVRYLVVWRVNGSLVWLPECLSAEVSRVLGATIVERLPTREAAPWRKALAPWDGYKAKEKHAAFPQAAWPIEAVLFVYPGKRTYGQGELIPWELKLMGEGADHGLFLEVILPAMEAAATTSDPRWYHQNSLWGRFDVYAVYAARGNHWESVVQEGKLDLGYHATPVQWTEGLASNANSERLYDNLTWLTPFDLSPAGGKTPGRKKIPANQVPTLQKILQALVARMTDLLPGKHHTPADLWNSLGEEERSALQQAIEDAARIPVQQSGISPAPRDWPGNWIGTQSFSFIPPTLVPYLELASILHIGKQTHFGCGTFSIT
ncbi:MAG: hypothetical protein CVU38_02980 [Chloroflexi bacterium HGW-Chloroflexi-1]|nr:MAG: hypothetical protein CVU38_02980 [Chloroflexi bacterium HGW-Chloroflexi-1]